MKVTVLGTGTSTGVPIATCNCRVCRSEKRENKRLRSSVLLALSAAEGNLNLLIDTTPDLRYQCLRAGIRRVDAVLYTHGHADHILGIDDLRAFNFVTGQNIPLYAAEGTAGKLELLFSYAFLPDEDYKGGAPPRLELTRIAPYQPVRFGTLDVLPLRLRHGELDVLGYRAKNFAYLTDCSAIPEESSAHLRDLEVLIIDGLRPRYHETHFNLEGAVREIERLGPKRAYLTHLSHDIDHDECNELLRTMTTIPVEAAYDGLIVEV